VLQARGLGLAWISPVVAPEAAPWLPGAAVRAARRFCVQVIRSLAKPDILLEPGQEDLLAFLAAEGRHRCFAFHCQVIFKEKTSRKQSGAAAWFLPAAFGGSARAQRLWATGKA